MTSPSEAHAPAATAATPAKRRGRPPGSKTKPKVVAAPKKTMKQEANRNPSIHPSFEPLADVLWAAYLQAAIGKGRDRHGGTIPLFDQPWVSISRASGPGFLTGQATKKIMEAARMRAKAAYDRGAYERELLGAVVYSAFAILYEQKGVGNAD